MELLYTAHVPGGDGPFPTILALHGWGASGHDLIGLAPILHAGRAIVLCPQGPVAFQPAPNMIGYGWFPLTQGGPPDPTAINMAQGLIEIFLEDACQRYPVDPQKIVLLGFSQGGLMAYRLALADPKRFAGLLALSTWLPEEETSESEKTEGLDRLPTLIMHGKEDPMIPIDRAHAARDALLSLEVPLTFREYEMGHEINQDALRDMVMWLEEKVFAGPPGA
ncbi:MAG: dienelactone hydrolase family protein [Myxococcota bacterium]